VHERGERTGAGLWIAGVRREHDPMLWSGVGIFAGARVYGAVSAPLATMLLNGTFRAQLGIQ
jgi:hypothetical protein